MNQPSSTPVPVLPSPSSVSVRGAFILFRDTWNTFFGVHLKNIFLFQLIIFLIYIGAGILIAILGGGVVFSLIVLPLKSAGAFQWSPLVIVGIFIIALLFIALILGSVFVGTAQSIFYLRVLEGQSASFGDAFKEGFRRFLVFFGTSIVTSCIVLGGLLLFVVPGVYWALRFGFAPFACLAEGLGVDASLRRSWALTKDLAWVALARWYVVMLIGSVIGVFQAIPLIGPFILAPFFITPLLGLLSWYLFREFQRVKNADPSYRTPYGVWKKIALLLPIILVPLLFVAFIMSAVLMGKNTESVETPYDASFPDEFYEDDFNGEIGPSDVPIPPVFDESETSS